MLAALANLALVVVGLALTIFWIHALVNWDGTRPCSPEDCKHCPFPPCEDKPKREGDQENE